MRILFHAINGTGLGHLMRLSAVAEAVRERAPQAHQLIATNASYESHLRRLRIPAVVLPFDDAAPQLEPDRRRASVSAELGGRLLGHVVREYDPDVVVFDTHAPRRVVADARVDGRGTVLVLRRYRTELLAEHLRSGRLAEFDLILVPYTRAAFAHRLPRGVQRALEELGTVRYTGGIAFPLALDPDAVTELAARHAIAPKAKLVLVTAGSGGYEALARTFVVNACAAADELRKSHRNVTTLCVGGPYATATAPRGQCRYVASEPALQLLVARADVVVAHAGYNSTHEILRVGAPAVLVPVPRRTEDQTVLADYLARRGRVRVVGPEAPRDAYLQAYVELLNAARPDAEPLPGATVAAREIVALAEGPVDYVCGVRAAEFTDAEQFPTPEALAQAVRSRAVRAAVRVDWDLVHRVIAALGPAAHDLVETLEVDLGDAATDELALRACDVDDSLDQAGIAPSRIVMSVEDATGGRRLAGLVERVPDLAIRALVARIPTGALERDSTALFAATNVCRDLAASYAIDVTIAGRSFVSVDQP